MVDLSVADGLVVLHVRGADKLWAFKSSLEIPRQAQNGMTKHKPRVGPNQTIERGQIK